MFSPVLLAYGCFRLSLSFHRRTHNRRTHNPPLADELSGATETKQNPLDFVAVGTSRICYTHIMAPLYFTTISIFDISHLIVVFWQSGIWW